MSNHLHPQDFDRFQQLAAQHAAIPVARTISADLDTPVTAFHKVAFGRPHAFLLESVEGGEQWGRYSFLGADFRGRIRLSGDSLTLIAPDGASTTLDGGLDSFRKLVFEEIAPLPDAPRFYGGAVGVIGYDWVRQIENIGNRHTAPDGWDDMEFLLTDTVVIFDNLKGKMQVVTVARPEREGGAEAAFAAAQGRIAAVVARLKGALPPLPAASGHPPEFIVDTSPEAFAANVARAREYIAAGDIMQVVLSRRWSAPFEEDPLNLYRAIRALNPSPYMYLIRLNDRAVVGSSPEILVRIEDGEAVVRPIAGTRRRGRTPADDAAMELELLADPKERAEHLMLLDLGRNDLGRIAATGTVRVREQMVIERYSHVMHMVSDVVAIPDPEVDAFDILKATFPAGTVSGAPKIRAMQIIEELEVNRRGPYAGAVGYIGANGNLDTAITIRTAIVEPGVVHIQAGAGLVADSVPELEELETRNKAAAMMAAVRQAAQGLP
ncbi:MAG: anthranilate synthase component I [Alphaproteobacteria bacterium CG_4_10_14_0_2_um_filter_63_37]|nr:MAG: hypothetical protein AUJ55_04150 [Proteobacteria bacterium CG1_02_64_396]PJA24136.1 MAG: anthranilate synthase component I [Alphaproteobacteria bacterium CG_4_10_14_0_2_um_filter_63_37]